MSWDRPHLLDIESLEPEEIIHILDTAREFKAVGQRSIKKSPVLRGKTVVNLFAEPSTRTRISFELAATRLSAHIVNFTTEASSIRKGETLKDTARNLEALNADIFIVRHEASGAAHFLARFLEGSVINAGDGAHGHPDWKVFLISALVSLFIGVCLVLVNRTGPANLSVRQAFLLTALSWTVITAVGALPFYFSDLGLSYTDAFFEAMSGLTTTGSTVIIGLDDAPPGILLWRALLQWLGGIGIIVMAVAVLPMLQIGGMQIFRTESSDQSEKVLPRAAQIAGAIGVIYLVLTVINGLCYWAAGMTVFEAFCHAMTTIATGGYSTSDDSIGQFDDTAIQSVAMICMVLGSLPFVLYLRAVRGGWRAGEKTRRWSMEWRVGRHAP